MSNPARAYLSTQVETTTQGELLIMLYDAAIKFLKRAKIEMEKKDYAQKGIYISKAIAVLGELSESLNKEKGGEITENLNSLYMFCNLHLAKANIRMDTKMIDEVIKIITGIRAAYAQIVPMMEKGAAGAGVKNSIGAGGGVPPVRPVTPAPSKKAAPAATTEQKASQTTQAETPEEPEVKQELTEQSETDTLQKTPMPEQTAPQPVSPPVMGKQKTMVSPLRLRANNAYSNNR